MSKVISPKEAISKIKPNSRVLALMGTSEPTALISALLDDRERLKTIEFVSGFSLGDCDFLKELYDDFINFTTWQVNPRIMRLVREGNIKFVSLPLSRIANAISPGGPLFPDVFLVQTSPPDDKGNLNLGTSVGYALGAAKKSPMVIAEINPEVPRTRGRTTIQMSDVECMIEAEKPLFMIEGREPKDSDTKIAGFVSELIPDGATVELGIGSIPNAVYDALHEKKNLGIHSGMVSDGIIGLMESGAVTNTKKSIDRGKIVIAEAVGTKKLYDYIDENPNLSMYPYEYTHNQATLSRIENLCAVNSAIEVDLAGQVNSEYLGGIQIGFGGLLDFAVGAYRSVGGKSIIALPSTKRKGEISSIVPRIPEGTPVTLPKWMVNYVVTEYGVVHLDNKSTRERAEAIIEIAHPDHRDRLSVDIPRIFR
jgi:4-hydroxybutyrate CoA-transferase